MATQEQINANRKNAQKSTGPITPEGKNAIKNNAVTHGLYATDIVINCKQFREDPKEFEDLHQSLKNEFRPIGKFQEHLVYSIATCIWKYRRSIIAETSHLNRQIDETKSKQNYNELLENLENSDLESDDRHEMMDIVNRIGIKVIPNDYFSQRLLRSQMRIDRQLRHNFKMMKQMQIEDKALGIKTKIYNCAWRPSPSAMNILLVHGDVHQPPKSEIDGDETSAGET